MKFYPFFLLVFGLSSATFLMSSTSDEVHLKEAVALNKHYLGQLRNFEKSITSFGSSSSKENFLNMRMAYKKCEVLLNYSDGFIARRLNGPNLTINEYDSLNPNEEKKAHGLQVIEYHLYVPEENSKQIIDDEIQLLKTTITSIRQKHENEQKSDFNLFNVLAWDAWRQEIFRVEALGITGFDTPECQNGLPETIVVLESLQQFVKIYRKSINKNDYKAFGELIKNAIQFIKTDLNFSNFDRLTFIRNYLHPLSRLITKTRQELGFEFPANVKPLAREAEHLYDLSIFNDTYFNSSSTDQRSKLGELLFNDKLLSLNNSRACVSCHNPNLGYTDGLTKNTNFEGTKELLRNTPSLVNAGWQTRFFYDSRVKSLEKQAVNVIHNPEEMGGDLKEIVLRIKGNSNYVLLFKEAYNGNINESTIVNALSVYINSLRSFESKTDRYLRGENVSLSNDEIKGFNLFTGKAKCATCHYLPLYNGLVPPFYTETESEKIGVSRTKSNPKEIDSDFGRYNYTHLELHRYAFKTPSLRSISRTAPYMHNGVFDNLEEVIDFYNKGGGAGQGMDFPQQTLGADSLGLSKQEQKSLLDFLKSL